MPAVDAQSGERVVEVSSSFSADELIFVGRMQRSLWRSRTACRPGMVWRRRGDALPGCSSRSRGMARWNGVLFCGAGRCRLRAGPHDPDASAAGLALSGLKCGRLLCGSVWRELGRSPLESWIGFERSLGLVWPQYAGCGERSGGRACGGAMAAAAVGRVGLGAVGERVYRGGRREVCRVRAAALEAGASPLRMGGAI